MNQKNRSSIQVSFNVFFEVLHVTRDDIKLARKYLQAAPTHRILSSYEFISALNLIITQDYVLRDKICA
jgi:hypothetical protein